MKLGTITFLLVMCAIMEVMYCKLLKVPIKSHKILTKDIITNSLEAIYDRNTSTRGLFYNDNLTTVEVEFDLEANYVIDRIEATIDSEKPEISFVVGNYVIDQGGLSYNCFLGKKSRFLYECIPKCRADDPTRNGIMARKLMMSFSVQKWSSIYEIEVYASLKNKDLSSISDYRLVQSDDCDSKSWLINNLEISNFKKISHKSGTKIFFEKPYIVTTVDVQFLENNQNTLKIQLSNGDKTQGVIELDLAKCTIADSKFTCQLKESTFPTRIVTIVSDGVTRISFQGKTVFYPTLSIKASTNKNEDLKLTCYFNPCDLSVHSSCLKDPLKPRVEFPCKNKRLIKVPSGGNNLEPYVIVNEGQVEKDWSETKFAVERNLDNRMVVSMPRSYQYFGQYKCSCILGDELKTEMQSNDTTLTETDFLQNSELIFKIEVQYKPQEKDEMFKEGNENVVAIHEKNIPNTFIKMVITSFSLVKEIVVETTVPTSPDVYETTTHRNFVPFNMRAFESNPRSWSVQVYRYVLDEFPEFIHNKDVVINYNLKMFNMTQKNLIRLLRVNKMSNTTPELIQEITNKWISIKAVYGGTAKQMVSVNEINCLKTLNRKLGILLGNNCTSFDKQVSCSKLEDVSILSVKQERNFATEYNYSFLNMETNITSYVYVNGSQHPDIKDIKTKLRYLDFNYDPINPDIAIVQLELELISKTINDFIPCGKVTLKTIESGKAIKELVLQQPRYRFSVGLASNSVNVAIKLEINDKEVYSADLEIENPKNFEVRNLAIQGDTNLRVVWKGIDKMAYGLLAGYEVKIVNTTLACNTVRDRKIMINKSEMFNDKNIYEAEIGLVNDKHSSMYVASVQPVFLNSQRGKLSQVEKKIILQKRTKIVISKVILTNQRSISIIPSQSDIPCAVKSVNFELKGIDIKNLTTSVKMIDDKNYIIDKLIPGRKYQLTAQAIYPGGPEDSVSKTYAFETIDEISVLQDSYVVQLNEKVNITCTVDIGPLDEFKKYAHWFRANKAPLPEGVLSQTINNKTFLIMEKTKPDYTGVYGCFIEPPASVSRPKNTYIIVNDLLVTPVNTKIDYSLPEAELQPIHVKCHSSVLGNHTWVGPDNSEILKENEHYNVESFITDNRIVESTLMIKKPSLKTSGKYNCWKSLGNFKVSREFLLYGEEKLDLNLLPNSSMLIGEKLRIRCKGQVGVQTQKVMWDVSSLPAGVKDSVKVVTPDPVDPYTQDIEIINDLTIASVSCKISPPVNPISTEMKKSYNINLAPKIEVDGPTKVMVGKPVTLTCTGYPIKHSMILEWVFFEEKKANATGVVVASSQNQLNPKSNEPIKLKLELTNVKEQEAGRYECKFKTEIKAEKFKTKSLSLFVDSNQNSLTNIGRSRGDPNRGNGAPSILNNIKFSISVSALFTVFFVFYRI